MSVSDKTSRCFESFLIPGLWIGLLTGFGEVAIQGIKYYLLGEFLTLSPHVAWMAPVVDALVFLILALLLALGNHALPSRITWRVAMGLLSTTMVFTWLIMFPQLHMAAAALFAAGVGVQLSRLMTRSQPGIQRMAKTGASGFSVILGVITVGMLLQARLAERRGLARLGPAEKAAPNVLLIILDTVRAMNLGLYGYPRPTTPEIEAWARSGVVFEDAFSVAPWTLPSHASMFTGKYPYQLNTDWETPLEPGPLTLAESLGRRGYSTAGFVANARYCGRETGLSRGFLHYEDYPITLGEILKSARLTDGFHSTFARRLHLPSLRPRAQADAISGNFLQWVDHRDPGRPFFVFLNYLDAHAPYQPPPAFRARFEQHPGAAIPNIEDRKPGKVNVLEKHFTPEEASASMDLYDGAIAYLDSQVGELLRSLDARGLLTNTVVVLAADHGEAFAEQGLLGHANSLYRPTVQVPLVISYPGHVPAGKRVTTPVSLRDLAATISELSGGTASDFPGSSLAQSWDGSNGPAHSPLLSHIRKLYNQPAWWPASKGAMFSLALDGLRYIKNEGDGQEELFDLATDAREQHNLAATPRGQSALPAIRQALAALRSDSAAH
ncbi:MAG: sulfatase [Gemmatimonadota bacterium]